MRSPLAEDKYATVLPFKDVIVDVQGPFTKGEGGEQYLLSYMCTRLKVCYLQAFKSLQKGYFSRALSDCIFAAKEIPDVIRTDRGPEMMSYVMEEVIALLNANHIPGASLTPRHQGLNERSHQVIMIDHHLLMDEITHAFPTEWAALVGAVEHAYFTAPLGAHGLSAIDMMRAYAIASPADRRLAPFMIPKGLPETDVASRMFTRFKEMYGIFTRCTQHKAALSELRENRDRHKRTLEKGEVVFWKLPIAARLPKHLFPSPCKGPYRVELQKTTTSAVLKDPTTGLLVNSGRNIPLDQILVGPSRAPLIWDDENEVRSLGMMLSEPADTGQEFASGFRAGRKKGWGPLAKGHLVAYQTMTQGVESRKLTIGKVLVNHRDDQKLLVQPYPVRLTEAYGKEFI